MLLFLWFATEEVLRAKSNGSRSEAHEFSRSLPGQKTRWSWWASLDLKTPFGKTPKQSCKISSLGVRVIMVTGDGPATARAVSTHNHHVPQLERFRLKVFRAVAEHLTFRKAAEHPFLTQPAVML